MNGNTLQPGDGIGQGNPTGIHYPMFDIDEEEARNILSRVSKPQTARISGDNLSISFTELQRTETAQAAYVLVIEAKHCRLHTGNGDAV